MQVLIPAVRKLLRNFGFALLEGPQAASRKFLSQESFSGLAPLHSSGRNFRTLQTRNKSRGARTAFPFAGSELKQQEPLFKIFVPCFQKLKLSSLWKFGAECCDLAILKFLYHPFVPCGSVQEGNSSSAVRLLNLGTFEKGDFCAFRASTGPSNSGNRNFRFRLTTSEGAKYLNSLETPNCQ